MKINFQLKFRSLRSQAQIPRIVKSAVVIEHERRQRDGTPITVDGQPRFILKLNNCSDKERTQILRIIARAGKSIIVDSTLPQEEKNSSIMSQLESLIAKKHSQSVFQLNLLR